MLAFQRHDRMILDKKSKSLKTDKDGVEELSSDTELFNLFHGDAKYDQK